MTPSPAIPEDRSLLVFAADSEVIAFRRTDGGVAWRHSFQASLLGLPARPLGAMDLAFHGGRVFVGARDCIACIDYASGALVGKVPLPGMVRRPCFLLEGEHLYVVASDRVMCLTHGGDVMWQSPHGLTLQSGPALGVPGNVRQGDDRGD